MHDTTFALTYLALFTTADKAAEIEGDLLEQARRHGNLWFWVHVALTGAALFLHNLRAEPGKLLLCSYAIYELVLKLNWMALNPLRSALRKGLALDTWQLPLMNYSVVALTAFSLALLVMKLAPKQGAQIALLSFGYLLGRALLLDGMAAAPRMLAFVLAPGLLGLLLMKWLELRRSASQNPDTAAV